MNIIEQRIKESIAIKQQILNDKKLLRKIKKTAQIMGEALKRGNKVILCGNGGSAADAQHLAAELLGRFYLDRAPLAALSLNTNTSIITAIANDFAYDEIFVRQLSALGRRGDVLLGISTSGTSPNVIEALQHAQEHGIATIALTGESGGSMHQYADILLNVPSRDTARIQESHIMIGHIICELVEQSFFKKSRLTGFMPRKPRLAGGVKRHVSKIKN